MQKFAHAGIAMSALLVLSMLGAAGVAHADIYIIESTAPTIKAGSQLRDSDNLALPAGTYVRALLPSGKTQTLKGPFNGAIADIGKGQLDSGGMLAWLRSFLQTGGANETTPGVTRSLVATTARPSAFSWTTIVTGQEGVVCVPQGKPLQLKRALTAKADRVMVVDKEAGARGEAEWAVGADAAAWPSAVAVRNGAIYDLLVPDRPKRSVTLRVLAGVPEEADILAQLHAQGCKPQFEAWLRETAIPRR